MKGKKTYKLCISIGSKKTFPSHFFAFGGSGIETMKKNLYQQYEKRNYSTKTEIN